MKKYLLFIYMLLFHIMLSACSTEVILNTLTFDTAGGAEVSSITQEFDSVLSAPVEPQKEGHTFVGWSPEFPNRMPATNLTLTAQWEINQYAITYNIYNNFDPLNDIPLKASETIASVSLGSSHSSALTSLSRVFMWGYNEQGQLGDGTTTQRNIPTDITSKFGLNEGETIESLSLGGAHSSTLTSTGRVFMWGSNEQGQLGDGTTTNRETPIEITSQFGLRSGETIVSLSLGDSYSSALTSLGRVFMWGWGGLGQLGDGTFTSRISPTEITSQFNLKEGETILSVTLGSAHSSALTSSGRVFMWGYNALGSLGDGTKTDRETPIEITSQFFLSEGEKILNLGLGGAHSSALTSMGRVFMWGFNGLGALGDGTKTDKITPTEITTQFGLSTGETIASIALGNIYSSAVTSFGRVFMWGYNEYGQLGDGTKTDRDIPTEITSQFVLSTGDKSLSISLGLWHSAALTSTGRVFMWGANKYGQIGDGTTINTDTPRDTTFKSVESTNKNVYNFNTPVDKTTPTREGHTLDGWYVDSSFTTKYNFTFMPAENLNLYGRWIPND